MLCSVFLVPLCSVVCLYVDALSWSYLMFSFYMDDTHDEQYPICLNPVFPFSDLSDDEFKNFFSTPLHEQKIDINKFKNTFKHSLECDPACDNDDEDFLQDDIVESNYYLEDEFMSLPKLDSDFSIIHFNARSLSKNFLAISEFIHSLSYSFSIYGFTETWIQSNTPILFHLEGYSFIHIDRISGRGGGVAFLVLDSLNFKIRNDILLQCDGNECLFIEITNRNGKNIIVGIIYRKPQSRVESFINAFYVCLQKLNKENKFIYIMGDFNIDLLKCSNKYSADFNM